jgi:glycosyltransferase involved in cell wall biosynthesis
VSLVSVLLAAHDAERFLTAAVASVLRQTVRDLELVVVDDGSSDRTAELLEEITDPRVVVVRNDERAGLAASLNRALDLASGRYVARLDADDVALPRRLERQLAVLRGHPRLAVAGSAVLELDEHGRLGRLLEMPSGSVAVRWHAHFGAPFLHPTVIVDREVLERDRLRYETRFAESEDFDLWSRLLEVADGDNLADPLILYRVHAGQATQRRHDLQQAFQREVALRRIRATAPGLDETDAQLAWLVGAGGEVPAGRAEQAVEAFLELLARFEAEHVIGPARPAAARAVARAAGAARGDARARIIRRALALRPSFALHAAAGRARRSRRAKLARPEAEDVLRALERDGTVEDRTAIRVTVVSPEPTPYRSGLFDRVADRPEVELTVLYARRTVAGRTWEIEPRHQAVMLHGVRVPGLRRVLRHDYPITPGVFAALAGSSPAVVVVSGWSTFSSQVAVPWCRRKRVPYVLLVESNDRDPRPAWRRFVKRLVVPPVVRRAAWVLAVGTLARDSVLARGARPERTGRFANTIDVADYVELADGLATRRGELRAELGAEADDVVVLSVARLAPEKGLDTLIRAAAEANEPRLLLVVAGSGPERDGLSRLAGDLGVRFALLGDVQPASRLVELYVAADVFALLSIHEPWGVVVNEAAACGLPLVLSDRVGAAYDLLEDGVNGHLVRAGDISGAASALGRLAADRGAREAFGARSRELVQGWGYEPSVDDFVTAVRAAAAR